MNVEPVSSRRRATHAETASVAGDLKTLPLPGVEKRLASPPEGISRAEAGTRLAAYGRNELVERKPSTLLTLLGYFWGPIPWMIDVAVVLSAVLGHWADFVTIVVLLLANAGSGSGRSTKPARRSTRSRPSSRSRRSCAARRDVGDHAVAGGGAR